MGAAEGEAGLLLFFADMVFSRGLLVAYGYYLFIYSRLATSTSFLLALALDKVILLSLDTCLWKGNQVL